MDAAAPSRNADHFAPPNPPVAGSVGRAAKGASLGEVLLRLDATLEAGRTGFIAVSILWSRLLGTKGDDRDVARHQAALVHRARRVLARRGVTNPFIFSSLERSPLERANLPTLHGHVVMECPQGLHGEVLDAVEDGLVRRHGPLPRRAFWRDGWHRGSITTADSALGAVMYRLKSLPSAPVELGVRRGVGLRPVEGVTVRCSNGRANLPPPTRGRSGESLKCPPAPAMRIERSEDEEPAAGRDNQTAWRS
jgi:hypothetical protein